MDANISGPLANDVCEGEDLSPAAATGWFWTIAVFFAALWVALPSLLHSGYRNDVVEIVFIGQEWVWSNLKHPALSSWIVEIIRILTDEAFCAPFLAAQFCTLITVGSVWCLARTVLPEKYALLAALAALPQRLLTHESVLYNHNLLLLACYSLVVSLVFQAFRTNRLFYWIAAGLSIGISLHNKYTAILVVFAILLYMFLRPAGRKHWRGIGPYVCTAVAVLVFLPHVIWLVQNDFAPFAYASHRRVFEGWWWIFLSPMKFALSQPLYWIPSLIVLFPALGWVWTWKTESREDETGKECERFLFYCCMVPIVFHLLLCAAKYNLRMVYGAPFWCFLSVWLLLRFRVKERPRLLGKTILCLAAVECVLAVGFVSAFLQGKQPQAVYLPVKTLSQECERIWKERNFSVPCSYTSGDLILSGHAALGMSDRPSVHASSSTWSNDDDVNRCGGLYLWPLTDTETDLPAEAKKRFPKIESPPEVLELPLSVKWKGQSTVKLGIAIIPPADGLQLNP